MVLKLRLPRLLALILHWLKMTTYGHSPCQIDSSSHSLQTPFFDNVDELQQHVGVGPMVKNKFNDYFSCQGINVQDILKLKVSL